MLPEISASAPQLSSPGRPVLPRHRPLPSSRDLPKSRPQPVLYPLAGLKATDLPENPPEFVAEVPPAMAAESWRFLVRLDAQGRVRDVVSLSGTPDAGQTALETWLRDVPFPESMDPASERWVAVGLSFINQPPHGTDSH
jgi:hypothetical protein